MVEIILQNFPCKDSPRPTCLLPRTVPPREQGVIDINRISGATGIQGPVGPTGPIGPTGATGSRGIPGAGFPTSTSYEDAAAYNLTITSMNSGTPGAFGVNAAQTFLGLETEVAISDVKINTVVTNFDVTSNVMSLTTNDNNLLNPGDMVTVKTYAAYASTGNLIDSMNSSSCINPGLVTDGTFVYTCEGNYVRQYDANMNFLQQSSSLSNTINCVALDGSGNVFCCDQSQNLYKLDNTLAMIDSVNLGSYGNGANMIIDGTSIFIAASNSYILAFSTADSLDYIASIFTGYSTYYAPLLVSGGMLYYGVYNFTVLQFPLDLSASTIIYLNKGYYIQELQELGGFVWAFDGSNYVSQISGTSIVNQTSISSFFPSGQIALYGGIWYGSYSGQAVVLDPTTLIPSNSVTAGNSTTSCTIVGTNLIYCTPSGNSWYIWDLSLQINETDTVLTASGSSMTLSTSLGDMHSNYIIMPKVTCGTVWPAGTYEIVNNSGSTFYIAPNFPNRYSNVIGTVTVTGRHSPLYGLSTYCTHYLVAPANAVVLYVTAGGGQVWVNDVPVSSNSNAEYQSGFNVQYGGLSVYVVPGQVTYINTSSTNVWFSYGLVVP